MTYEDRLISLEKRVAALEVQAQEQPEKTIRAFVTGIEKDSLRLPGCCKLIGSKDVGADQG